MSLIDKKVDAIARILLSDNPVDLAKAREDLKRLLKTEEDYLPDAVTLQIHNLLAEVGINTRQTGHIFLVEAIRIIIDEPMVTVGMTCPDGLLDRVGAKFCRTSKTIERAMRKSIECAWQHGSQEFQSKHYTIISQKTFAPSLSYFLTRSASLVRQQLAEK